MASNKELIRMLHASEVDLLRSKEDLQNTRKKNEAQMQTIQNQMMKIESLEKRLAALDAIMEKLKQLYSK